MKHRYRPDFTGSSCVTSITRAALLALRTSNSLDVNCDYVITDFVQGRFLAGTTLHLQAVAPNELSETVSVNSLFDNEGWLGTYDIDRNLLIYVKDNRNNEVRDFNGTAVSNFDWGNANWTNNVVDASTVTVTYGSVRPVTDCVFESGSTITLTGWSNGSLTNLRVSASTLNLTNASISFSAVEITEGSTFTASGYVGGGTQIRSTLRKLATVDITNSTAIFSLAESTLTGSTINHIAVTTGVFTGSRVIAESGVTITHNNGAGTMAITRSFFETGSTITHTSSTITIIDCTMTEQSTISKPTGTGSITMNVCRLLRGSNITHNSDVTLSLTRDTLENVGSVTCTAGSGGTLTITNTTIQNSSSITCGATAISGALTVTNSLIDSSSFISKNNTGGGTISTSSLIGASGITYSNTRSCNVTRGLLRSVARINIGGTGAVTDVITDVDMDSRSTANMNASGAAANSLVFGRISGNASTVGITGTSTGQTLQNFDTIGSNIFLVNCTVTNTVSNVVVHGVSALNVQNLATAKAISNVSATGGSTILITAPTGVGGLTLLAADAGGNMTISGPTGSITRAAVSTGNLAINGGTAHTAITKHMAGTLTTGNFNFTNVIAITPNNIVGTAVNTNRATYLGLASGVPII